MLVLLVQLVHCTRHLDAMAASTSTKYYISAIY